MRVVFVHPSIGRRVGQRYIRSWQMEPLPVAAIAGATPEGVDFRFFDDRLEEIDFDEPADLVAISVETYTARRAYQIASEFRQRGVPVVMGGFHATLCPEEVADYAETVVIGEAETLWPEVIDDYRHGTPKQFYRAAKRPSMDKVVYDRTPFAGKRYLPIRLVETGRGCRFRCEFCAIQTFFDGSHSRRSIGGILDELAALRSSTKVFFFVDDNFAADLEAAKEFMRALIPLRIRWITQLSINAAHDEEFLELLNASGCQGVLIGFESTDPETLHLMNKGFALGQAGPRAAVEKLRRHRIRVYGTFVFGYDRDTPESFRDALDFANGNGFYIAAFNHLTPFPGTPLYHRLEAEGRMRFDRWWLDPAYDYNTVPFHPTNMTPEELRRHCVATRRAFYSVPGIARRALAAANRSNNFMLRNYFPINLLHRREISVRDSFPLGDAAWQGQLIKVG